MNLKVVRSYKVRGKEYGKIEYKVERRKMGFKGLKRLCFGDCGAGHVSNSAQHPCFLSNLLYSYLLHFSSELDV